MALAGWIILGIILLLIVIIFFIPYGVDILYQKEILHLGIKAGPICIRILPKKPLSEKQLAKKEEKKNKKALKKQEKAEKKASQKAKEEIDSSIKVKPKKPLDFEFLFALLKMGLHAIKRLFKSFTIDVFKLYYCVASADPYDTSVTYGYVCALAEALPELCGKSIRIHKREVVIDADYTAEKPNIDLHIAFTLQLFKIVHLAIAFGLEFIKYKKEHRVDSIAMDMKGNVA